MKLHRDPDYDDPYLVGTPNSLFGAIMKAIIGGGLTIALFWFVMSAMTGRPLTFDML